MYYVNVSKHTHQSRGNPGMPEHAQQFSVLVD